VASHALFDTTRGTNAYLSTNSTSSEDTAFTDLLTAFGTTGFTLGADAGMGITNSTSQTYVAWTFRKAPKFFDIVTYTGNGANRTIAHNLGQAPGMIFIKRRNSPSPWTVYHRSLANTEYVVLNTTAAKVTGATTYWNSTTADASSVGVLRLMGVG
jgi:hypothetical protein